MTKSLLNSVKEGKITNDQANLILYVIFFLTEEYWRQVWEGKIKR